MKKSNVMAMLFAGLITISCADGKKDAVVDTTDIETTDASTAEGSKYADVSNEVINDYMKVKDALVETDNKKVTEASEKLVDGLKKFNLDDQAATLSPAIVSATEHAETMIGKDIEKQREVFELLSEDILEIVNKTGTNTTLYQQHCPMYGEDGANWLSTDEKIRNPYFGEKMMNCGSTQKVIK